MTGFPKVQILEKENKTKWRKDRTETKFFGTRLVIYKQVKKIAKEKNVSCEEAANLLEVRRLELGVSTDKLIKILEART